MLGTEFAKDTKNRHTALSIPEYILMKMVSDTECGSTNLTEIREYLAITKAAVSQMLSSLEKRGLVTREVDPANRRNLIVLLTPLGRELLCMKDTEAEMRISKIAACLGEKEMDQFIQLISKLNDAIKASKED